MAYYVGNEFTMIIIEAKANNLEQIIVLNFEFKTGKQTTREKSILNKLSLEIKTERLKKLIFKENLMYVNL